MRASPDAEARLEIQRGAYSCQAPVRHDRDPVAEDIGLFHGVRGEDDGALRLVAPDDVPRQPATTGGVPQYLCKVCFTTDYECTVLSEESADAAQRGSTVI